MRITREEPGFHISHVALHAHVPVCVRACGHVLPLVGVHCVTVRVPVTGVTGAPSGL